LKSLPPNRHEAVLQRAVDSLVIRRQRTRGNGSPQGSQPYDRIEAREPRIDETSEIPAREIEH